MTPSSPGHEVITVGNIHCFVFNSHFHKATAIISVHESILGKRTLTLASVRVLDLAWADSQEPPKQILEKLSAQTNNLQRKIAVLDALGLSEQEFGKVFAAGRIFAWSDTDIAIADVFSFVARCILDIERLLDIRFVVQPDYDQMHYHKVLGSILDAIDFQTKHIPSAIGTVANFETVMRLCGLEITNSHWGVIGIGELGGRIVKLLLERGVAHMVICDIERNKMLKFNGDLISQTDNMVKVLETASLHAVIFSANSGSLTTDAAYKCASMPELIAVGGPEAGLDQNLEALSILSKSGKHFIPSVLCGAMGLVSNLEEILGIVVDLKYQESMMKKHTLSLMKTSLAKKRCFHDVFKEETESWLTRGFGSG